MQSSLKKLKFRGKFTSNCKGISEDTVGNGLGEDCLSQDLQIPITLGKYCFCVGDISVRITLKLSLWDAPGTEFSGEILWKMNSGSNNEIIVISFVLATTL